MTVTELIEKLTELPENAEVYIEDESKPITFVYRSEVYYHDTGNVADIVICMT